MPAWPHTLAACSQLRHLALGSAAVQPALPPGAWLGGLRRLAVPKETAAASLAALQAEAPRLEILGVAGLKGDQPACEALLGLAAAHPALRLLALDAGSRVAPAELSGAVAEAQQRKPGLTVVWVHSEAWSTAVALGGDAELARMRDVFAGRRQFD